MRMPSAARREGFCVMKLNFDEIGTTVVLKRILRTLLAMSPPHPKVATYGNKTLLIHRDHEHPGFWRITRFDDLGPLGHMSFPSWSEAIDDLRDYPVDFASVRDVSPSTI